MTAQSEVLADAEASPNAAASPVAMRRKEAV
jgi:hypothetical protein